MNSIDYRDPEWVAEKLGVDKNTVYKHLQDGTIPGLQLGRKWLVSEAKLLEWLESETQRQTQTRKQATASSEHIVRQLTNYSVRMRDVLRRAHAEARCYGHRELGQEHLILAMAADPKCAAARIMTGEGVTGEQLRQAFEKSCPAGESVSARRLGRSATAKKAMHLAAEEAVKNGSKLIGTREVLAGILVAQEGIGFEILRDAGLSVNSIRKSKINLGEE